MIIKLESALHRNQEHHILQDQVCRPVAAWRVCLVCPGIVCLVLTSVSGIAESNQIDEPLLNLLQQNADAARAAGQPEPAEFMEKIRDAARKFLIK